MSDVTYTDPPSVGALVLEDNLPAPCPKCDRVTAMLIRQGDQGSTVQCCGCGSWWFREGDAETWAKEAT